MAKRLTDKQAGFVDAYIETGNGTQSAKKVYKVKSDNSAGVIANENLAKPKIQSIISRALAKKKITEDTIAQKIADGLEAKKVAFNFETKTFEVLEYPDYAIQHKFLTSLIDILGVKAPEKHDHKFAGVLGIDTLAQIAGRLGINQE